MAKASMHPHFKSAIFSVDVDVTLMDINQCDWGNDGTRSLRTMSFWNSSSIINAFRNTHKCDKRTTKVCRKA